MGSVTSLAGLTEQVKPKIFSTPGLVTGQGNGALYVHKLYPTLPNLDAQGAQSVWVARPTHLHSICQTILQLYFLHNQIDFQFHTTWSAFPHQPDGWICGHKK